MKNLIVTDPALLKSLIEGEAAPTPTARRQPAAEGGGDLFDKGVIWQESRGRQFDKNGKTLESTIIRNGVRQQGAMGIAQVMEGTAPEAAALAGLPYDRDRWLNDADYNKALGRAYFDHQRSTFGDDAKALAAYNAGPGAVRNAVKKAESSGNPDDWLRFLPAETRDYVPTILGRMGGELLARSGPASRGGDVAQLARQSAQPAERDNDIPTHFLGSGDPPPKPATLGDFGKSFGASALQATGAIGQFVGEAGAAVANQITGTQDYVGKNLLAGAADAVRDSMTEGGKRARQDSQITGTVTDIATGNWGNIRTPDTLQGWGMLGTEGFGSLVPLVFAPLKAIATAAKLQKAAQAATAAGKTAEAATLMARANAAAKTASRIGAATGTAMAGGAAAHEARTNVGAELDALSHEELMQGVPIYAEAFNRTGDEQQARNTVHNRAGQFSAMLAAPAGALGGYLGGKVLTDMVMRRGILPRVAGGGLSQTLPRVAAGTAVGAMIEGGQETTETMATNAGENLAMGRGATDNIDRNTAGAFIGGAVVGGPIGGAGSIRARPDLAERDGRPQGPLERAAAAGQPADAPPAGAATPDPISLRVKEIEAEVREGSLLETLRAIGQPERTVVEFLDALAVASNPQADPRGRQQAIESLEMAMGWIRDGKMPGDPATGSPFSTELSVPPAPPVPGTDLSAPAATGVGPSGEAQFFDPDTFDVDAIRVDNMIEGPRAIEGERAALPGPRGLGFEAAEQDADTNTGAAPNVQDAPPAAAGTQAQTPASEAPAPASGDAAAAPGVSPAPGVGDAQADGVAQAEQPVARRQVPLPKVAIPEGSAPAIQRQEAARIEAAVERGFDTVERRDDGAYLVNTATNQESKLSGLGAMARARQIIKRRIDAAAHQAATSPLNDLDEPTEEQAKAGNYIKGKARWRGLSISIENPAGSTRKGKDKDGQPWESVMGAHYGYILDTKGADGDAVDISIGPRPDLPGIYVVDQVDPQTGEFDEHKVRVGYPSLEAAREGYLADYEPGWQGLGSIVEMSPEQFRAWVKSGNARLPASDFVPGAPKVKRPNRVRVDAQAQAAAVSRLNEALSKAEQGLVVLADPQDEQTQALDALLDAWASLTGKRGIAVSTAADPAADASARASGGFDGLQLGDNFFVNVDRPQMNVAQTIAHEFKHLTERSPAMAKLYERIWSMISEQGRRQYYEGYLAPNTPGMAPTLEAATPADLERLRSEMVADFFGQRFNDRAWLRQLAKQKPALFGDFVRDWLRVLNSLIGKIKALAGQPDLAIQQKKNIDQYIAQLEEAKAIATEVATEWAQRNADLAKKAGIEPTGALMSAKDRSDEFPDADLMDEDMEAMLQDELQAEMDGGFDMDDGGDTFSPAALKRAGLMAEDLMGDLRVVMKAPGRGEIRVPDFHREGKEAIFLLESPDEADGLWSVSMGVTWVGPAMGGDEGFATLQGVKDYVRRLAAGRQLGREGFDLAKTITKQQARDLVENWRGLAGIEKAYRYGKAPAGAKSIPEIAAGMGITNAYNITVDISEGDTGATAYNVNFRPKDGGQTYSATIELHQVAGRKHLTASTIGLGGSTLGGAFYQLAAEMAVRNGMKLSPEGQVSGINSYRRTEQMISAALRTGKSNAMVPHYIQRVHGFNDDAKTVEQHNENLTRLLLAAVRNVREIAPELADVVYHPEANAYTMPDGSPADRLMTEVLARPDARAFGLGRAQIARAALTRQILAGEIKAADVKAINSPILYSARDKAAQEYQAVLDEHRGKPTWMKAPNGQPTRLSERQWVQVRTPSFRAWFGDWERFAGMDGGVWADGSNAVSKAVNPDTGEPLVLYHGTDKGGFLAFRETGGQRRGDLGIFTTSNYDMARSYVRRGRVRDIEIPQDRADLEEAGYQFEDEEDGRVRLLDADGYEVDSFASEQDAVNEALRTFAGDGDTSTVYAVFANLRDVLEEDFQGADWRGSFNGLDKWEVYDANGDTAYTADGAEFMSRDQAKKLAKSLGGSYETASDLPFTSDGVAREARDMRMSGAILRNIVDDGGGGGNYDHKPSDVYVAFDPSDVKSADWNTGEFGTGTSSLRFSPREAQQLTRNVPVVDPDFLVGKSYFPIPADLTIAGTYFEGVDSSTVAIPVLTQGGPLFPAINEYTDASIGWAVNDLATARKKLSRIKGGQKAYGIVSAMSQVAHQSNKTVVESVIGVISAYYRDGRMSRADMDGLDAYLRGYSYQVKVKKDGEEVIETRNFAAMPVRLHEADTEAGLSRLLSYIERDLTFDDRAALSSALALKKGSEAHNGPNITRVLDALMQPEFAGADFGDGLVVIELDPISDKALVKAEEIGVTPHNSYKYLIKGKIVGKLSRSVAWNTLFPDFFSKRRAEGKPESSDKIAFMRALPVQLGEQAMFEGLSTGALPNSKTAKVAMDFAAGNWRSSMDAKKSGGVAPADFVAAINESTYAATLTNYTLADLREQKKGIKIYQLADHRIFFALKRGDPGYGDYMQMVPGAPGFDASDVMLTGVVSNEAAVRGIAPAILLKAIEEGVTCLDCFTVNNYNYPRGFLPTLYRFFGFQRVASVPFDPALVLESGGTNKLRDMEYAWTRDGWTPQRDGNGLISNYPEVVAMKWTGTNEDRLNATDRFIRTGDHRAALARGDNQGRVLGPITDTREAYRSGSGQDSGRGGAGRPDAGGDSRDLPDRDRARLAERIRRSVIAVAGLSEADVRAFNLDAQRAQLVRERYADVKLSARVPKSTVVRLSVDELVASAESMGTWRDWYDRHEQVISDLFGQDARLFQKILSATSQAASVKANVGLALKAYRQLLSGEAFVGYLPAVIKNLQRIKDNEALAGAKISQYDDANNGDDGAIAVDRHIAMLFFDTKTPSALQIVSAKEAIRSTAARLGWKPKEVQAALWAFNQVRLGTDPTKVISYDTVLQAKSEKIGQLRTQLGRGEAAGVRADGPADQRDAGAPGVSGRPGAGDVRRNAREPDDARGRQQGGAFGRPENDDGSRGAERADAGPINGRGAGGGVGQRNLGAGGQRQIAGDVVGASAAQDGQANGRLKPLPGYNVRPAVGTAFGPDARLVSIAERYAQQNGIELRRQAEYVKVDEARATRLAQAYADMPHAPQDAKVKEAYANLIRQTTAQYQALVDAGYKFWFVDLKRQDNLDYIESPWTAMRDLRDNQTMGVFPTESGFGSDASFDPSDNPLLGQTGLMWPSGNLTGEMKPVYFNDVFRAVHDAFGHGLEGAGFRADGEENAWQAHVRLFTGSAVDAITSETRGQNSLVNYGPSGGANRTASAIDTEFAPQKTGLMPPWTWTEGVIGDIQYSKREDQDERPNTPTRELADLRRSGGGDSANNGTPPRYGTPRAGAVSATGYHFSRQPRTSLSSAFYGTGLKGAEAERLGGTENADIRPRVFFYVDKGNGVRAESGVGGYGHHVRLDNLYDAYRDDLNLIKGVRGMPGSKQSNWERVVLEAGFDGYLALDPIMPQGFAVLLGKKHGAVPVAQTRAPGVQPNPTIERPVDARATTAEGNDLVKKPTGEQMLQLVAPAKQNKIKAAAPSFLLQYGSFRVNRSEAAAADAAIAEFSPSFRFGDVRMSARDPQTETPAFKKWFGDSQARERMASSKQKFADMRPLVMYHTTRNADFTAFEANRPTINSTTFGDDETSRAAIFFTPSVEDSNAYGQLSDGRTVKGAATMPVYLRAQDPLYLTEGLDEEDAQRLMETGLSSRFIYNSLGHWSMFDDAEGRELVEAFKRAGYDSVVFNDQNPNTGESFEAWAVFEPTQIKSAIGNNGGFDPGNPDIRFSKRDTERAEKAGFDTSKTWYHGTVAKDFKSFRMGSPNRSVNELGVGIYFTGRPDVAEAWAGRPSDGGRIIPVYLKKGDVFDSGKKVDHLALARRLKERNPVTENERRAEKIRESKLVTEWTDEEQRIVNETGAELWRTWLLASDQDLADNIRRSSLNVWLDRAGYIGRKNDNSQIADQVVVFRPEYARTPWAKFSPAKAGSGNLLASAREQAETPAFKRWFGGSQVVDANGNPLVMYHGTSASQDGDAFAYFDTYASNYGLMGMGGYFTADPAVASSYTTKGRGSSPSVYPVFLSIKNPLDMDAPADGAAWARQFDGIKEYHEGGTTNESWYRAAEEMLGDQGLPKYEGAEIMQDGLRAMGFDGVTHMGGGRVKADGVRHRVYIAFEPEQIKSATGNNGGFDPGNPDIRYSARTPGELFFSELARQIEKASMKQALPGAWKTFIKALSSKGVKADEIEWTGVNEWLDLQPGKVKREELLAYLEGNGVQVEEVVLGGRLMGREADEALYAWVEENGNREAAAFNPKWREFYDSVLGGDTTGETLAIAGRLGVTGRPMELLQGAYDGFLPEGPAMPKYGQYTLPGGDNYREVLLTLPAKAGPSFKTASEARAWAKENGKTGSIREQDDGSFALMRDTTGGYKSGHWDHANILAHIRLNDRIDVDGAKTLFVEEVQSDFGQDIKKKGMASRVMTEAQRAAKLAEAKSLTAAIRQRSNADRAAGLEQISDETLELNKADSLRASEIMREMEDDKAAALANTSKLPRAPFVDTTDKWLNLALKRIIAMAVDEGYDKVAFVTGDQSAERYDLSKSISQIEYRRRPAGGGRLMARNLQRQSVISAPLDSDAELENHVGRDVAKKLLDAPSYGIQGSDAKIHALEGLDLKVGGEGMKTFYNAIVPNAAKAMLKKLGGGRMGVVEIVADPNVELDMWEPTDGPGDGSRAPVEQLTQPGFKITDAMREKVAEGLPLFSARDQTQTEAFKRWFGDREEINGNIALPGVNNIDVVAQRGRFSSIYGWTGAGSGKSREALQLLRAFGGGNLDVHDPGEPGSKSYSYWEKMAKEGLVDKMFDDEGNEIWPAREGGNPDTRSSAREQTEAPESNDSPDRVEWDGQIGKFKTSVPGVSDFQVADGADGELEIVHLEVSEDQRRAGMGRAAVADLEEWALNEGYTSLTASSVRSALPFWRALGFDAIGRDGKLTAMRMDIARKPSSNSSQINPDIRRSARSTWDMPEPTRFDDFVYKMQDKLVDLKRVTQSIKKTVGGLAEDLDAYLQEELFHGRTAKRTHDFGVQELQPLMEQIGANGLTMADVEEYLHARHAKEANRVIAQRNPGVPEMQDGGSGMENAEADAYFARLSPADRAKLDAAATRVDDIIRATRQLYVSYGLESQDAVDGWESMFQHYIPLQREDKDGSGSGMSVGQGFSVKGKETRGRTGSKRKVVDIMANIALQRERLIVRGEKNRVALALLGMAAANPNPGFWQVGPPPAERVYDPKTNTVVERVNPMWRMRDNVVMAKVHRPNGEVQEMGVVFNEDDPRAMRLAGAMKNLDAAQLEGLLGVSAKITRYFAAINTQYNPIFGVVNLVRDVQGAMVNLGGTPLAGQRARIAKDTFSALAGIYGDLRAERRGGQANSQWAQLWDEFQSVGGKTGFRELFSTPQDRAEALQDIVNPEAWAEGPWGKVFTAGGALKMPVGQAKRAAEGLFNWLSDYNDALENGVRLAAYKAGLDQGMSQRQAASLAKNLTVNFNRKGQVGMQAGAVYAFFNAAMQGTARLGQVLFEMDGGDLKTVRLSKTGKKVVYGGVLLGVVQALALAAAGFDDEDPPGFVRERSLVIPVGDKKYLTIPMPLGLHVIPGLGRHMTEFALSGFDKPAQRAIDIMGMFADSFNPIGNAGLSMQTLAPTALDPLVALTENKDWTGKPIARTSMNEATPGHALHKDTASTWSKALSEAVNWVTGGSEYVAGVVSPTPDQIDYLIGQVTGGVGREISKIDQSGRALWSGEELPTFKMPLVGRFIGNADSQASEGTAFYANSARLNELETEAKGMRGDGRTAEAQQLLAGRPDAYLIAVANTAERQIQRLRREKRALMEDGAPREQVKAVEKRITEAMARLNRAVERNKEAQAMAN